MKSDTGENRDAVVQSTSHDAPFQSENNSNGKQDKVELLIKRYRDSHGIALLFSRTIDEFEAFQEFMKYLVLAMNFEKALMLRLGKEITFIAQYGYDEAVLKEKITHDGNLLSKLSKFIHDQNASEDVELITVDGEHDDDKKIFDLARYLIGYVVDGKERLFVITGYENQVKENSTNEDSLSTEDTYWFSQLVLLSGAFSGKIKLFNELQKKAKENLLLAEQREKQIEDRTRALLDALFDAKKFRLVLERADLLVAMIDAASRRYIYVNALWETLTGFSRNDVVGKKTFDILKLNPLEHALVLFSSEFDEYITLHGVFHGSYVYTTQNGEEYAFSLSISRFDDDAGGFVYVVIGRDITEDRERTLREKEHVEEVEKLNQLMINRELRIIELKRQILAKGSTQNNV